MLGATLADPGVRNYCTGLLGWTRSQCDAGRWFWSSLRIMQIEGRVAMRESNAFQRTGLWQVPSRLTGAELPQSHQTPLTAAVEEGVRANPEVDRGEGNHFHEKAGQVSLSGFFLMDAAAQDRHGMDRNVSDTGRHLW